MVDNILKKIALFIYPKFKYLDDSLYIARKKVALYQDVSKKDLMREALGGITLDMSVKDNYLKGLTIEEIRGLNMWGFQLHEGIWWQKFTEWALNNQAGKVVGNVLREREKSIFGAGQLDGIMFIRELVESRRNAYLIDTQPEEGFDQNQPIP